MDARRLSSLLLMLLPVCCAAAEVRRYPLADFSCRADDLTSYTGSVSAYRRETGRTRLTIHTDWDTDEPVVLRHPGTKDPSGSFRIDGRPFTASDWTRIERSAGVLRGGMRATAWVCADGRVVLDWSAPRE